MLSPTDPIDELRGWLADNWSPDLTVGEWWERLGMAGWSQPLLPPDKYGHGLSQGDAVRVQQAIAEHGALGAPQGLGLMLAAPTIAAHGTREQIDRYVPDIVTGRIAWCQLFSEPGSGSDLASLATRATRDGDVWTINGQKVWTSAGHLADLGMLLARTNPDVPKHQGITWFVLDMHQPGVDVRPLKEMTGHTMFSEVFMTDAELHDAARIGDVNNGWAVANTTLAYERASMGAGAVGGRRAAMALPGTVAGMLGRKVSEFVTTDRPKRVAVPGTGGAARRGSPAKAYIDLARTTGHVDDPHIRQDLMRLHTFGELARLNGARAKAYRAQGRDVPGIANFSKLMMADNLRLSRDLGLRLLGARGLLHGYAHADAMALIELDGGLGPSMATGLALQAQALPIYGGTDQIQRNIVGERVLGLAKEPGDSNTVAFHQIPRNT